MTERPASSLSTDPVVAGLVRRCTFPADAHEVCCAVSGGPDSSALLVLAVAAGHDVTAVHVDHALRAGSGVEADQVAELARRFGASFRAERAPVEPGPNLEARARAARWAVLPPAALTGHTADDQAETVLLNLVRGAALPGLAGMAPERHPLLDLRRHETEALCTHVGIEPLRDPSNTDPALRRNRIRHELLPLLDDIAGRDVVAVIARQARILRADDELLETLASDLDPGDVAVIATAPAPVARRALRSWLRSFSPDGQPPPSDALDRVLAVARGEALAAEIPGGARVRRQQGRLVPEGPAGPTTGR